ncbi:MAG: invasion associated locus B family protein [Pseudomonadota bacterium]
MRARLKRVKICKTRTARGWRGPFWAARARRWIGASALLIIAAIPPGPTSSPARAQASGTVTTEGDWERRCDETGKCIIATAISTAEGQLVARLLLRRHPQDGLRGEIESPQGLHIPTGVLAAVDDSFRFRPQLITCARTACLSAFPATDEVVDAMKKGGKLTATFVDIRSGRPVALPFSLIGFTAQVDAL